MNEKSQSTRKASTLKSWFRAWLMVVAASFVIILVIAGLNKSLPGISWQWFPAVVATLIYSVVIATVLLGLWEFVRWLCCWLNLKRFLFGLACFITLIAMFYAEEDWRGRHDWNAFKMQWEAKGERFDWQSVVPPPVPADQNFAFSPVWIAEDKCVFRNTPKRAEAWYGDRINSAEVAKIEKLLPVTETGLVGTNWWSQKGLPNAPDYGGGWATARMWDLRPWQSYYRNLETVYPAAEIPITPQPQSPAADVLLALSKFDPVIEQLSADSVQPDSRFPIGYDDADKAAILLPHLATLKRFSLVLRLRAIAELQAGESEKALADIKLMLRLIEAIRSEPFLISHLVRLADLQITLQPIYEGLAQRKWSDAQLAELDSKLAKLDFLADYKLAMRGELGFQGGNIDYLNHNRRELLSFFDGYSGNIYHSYPSLPPFIGSLIPTGWFYQNRLNCARMMVKYYIPLADVNQQTVSPAADQRANEALQAEIKSTTPYNLFEKMLFPFFGHTIQKFAYAQSSVDLARVAIALGRYRLAQGKYPDSLDVLAPLFMKIIPHDVIGGAPLQYRRTEDGQFVLYSIGWNERDDGGEVVLLKVSTPAPDIDQGDWVWRYPSK